jgi:aminomethyltransferase
MRATPSLTHFEQPLQLTHFHARTSALCRTLRWGPWAGYASVLSYEDTAMEYTAIRNAASLYDLCPMIKYRITGPDAAACLNHLTVRDAGQLSTGGVHYTLWCDDRGKILDDGTLFRLSEDEFRLCCQERHLPWLLESADNFDVEIRDETDEVAALSLQGPTSAAILIAAGFDVRELKPFRMAGFPFGSGHITISRTGFTGDLGYELWLAPDDALALWDHLFAFGALHGLRPIGSDALNIARLEAGFVITNLDFTPAHQALREDRSRSPFEMGLDWLISWDKGHFTGRRALLKEREDNSSRWTFVGLEIEGNNEAPGAILYHDRKTEAGVITASCWSPTLKKPIALAQLDRKYMGGHNLWAEIYALRELHYVKLMEKVKVVQRPFFKTPRRSATPPGRF